MTPTFSEVLDLFVQKCKARGREPATIKSYRYYKDRFLGPVIGGKAVDELTFQDFERLYIAILEAGYATSSIRKCHATAMGALRLAEREGYVTSNVARLADLPKVTPPELVIPTPEEVGRLLDFAARHDQDIHDFARIAAATGVRPGENCGLMLEDLDGADVLTVSRAVDVCEGGARLKGTKTGKTRRVSLDTETAEIFRSRPGPFIYGGDLPARTDLMSKRFKRVALRAGLPSLKARMLRHFHATQLLASGRLSVKQVGERLGHANAIMLLTVYAAYIPQLDVVAADVIKDVLPSVLHKRAGDE